MRAPRLLGARGERFLGAVAMRAPRLLGARGSHFLSAGVLGPCGLRGPGENVF